VRTDAGEVLGPDEMVVFRRGYGENGVVGKHEGYSGGEGHRRTTGSSMDNADEERDEAILRASPPRLQQIDDRVAFRWMETAISFLKKEGV